METTLSGILAIPKGMLIIVTTIILNNIAPVTLLIYNIIIKSKPNMESSVEVFVKSP